MKCSNNENEIVTFEALKNGGDFEPFCTNICYQRSLSLNTPIYRYLDLEHFYEMLSQKQFYIAKRSSFSDRYEKGWRKNIRFMFDLIVLGDEQFEKEQLDRHDKRKAELKNVFISCWTFDSHILEGKNYEDYHMWSSRNEYTVRIKTTINDLLSCIDYQQMPVLLSSVKYEEDKRTRSLFEQVFQKTPEYANEQEIRLCIPQEVENNLLPITDIGNFVHQVTLSPFLHPSLANALKQLLAEKWPDLKGKIQKSAIAEY